MAESLREFTLVRLMNVERCQAAADPRPRRLRLWVRLYRLPESTPTIAIYYYYSALKLILILPSYTTVGRRLSRPSWLVTYRDGYIHTWIVHNYDIRTTFFELNWRTKLILNQIQVFFQKPKLNWNKKYLFCTSRAAVVVKLDLQWHRGLHAIYYFLAKFKIAAPKRKCEDEDLARDLTHDR